MCKYLPSILMFSFFMLGWASTSQAGCPDPLLEYHAQQLGTEKRDSARSSRHIPTFGKTRLYKKLAGFIERNESIKKGRNIEMLNLKSKKTLQRIRDVDILSVIFACSAVPLFILAALFMGSPIGFFTIVGIFLGIGIYSLFWGLRRTNPTGFRGRVAVIGNLIFAFFFMPVLVLAYFFPG